MPGLNSNSNFNYGNSPKFGNREDLFNSTAVKELNTYSSWDEMPLLAIDGSDPEFVLEGDNVKEVAPKETTTGIRSIFNKRLLVPKLQDHTRVKLNTPLVDSVETRRQIKADSDPSIKNLIKHSRSGRLGRETYDYSDFMYCKYLGKMPNNYLITLRRFPIACNDYIGQLVDNGREREISAPLGCMVTWLGTPGNDIESILTYSFHMPFKEITAELWDGQHNDDVASPLGSFFSAFSSKYQSQMQQGLAGSRLIEPWNKYVGEKWNPLKMTSNPPYSDNLQFKDPHKTMGPVDVIKTTSMRSDNGLTFEHSFSLQFEYELRSYSNINARQAMLDLIANILAVTYTNGSFWPGGFRGTGPHQSDLFSNLNIMKEHGGFTGFIDAAAKDITTIASTAAINIQKQGGIINTLKNLANQFGGMILGGLLNKFGRPQKQALPSLLSPAPVGLWHVTIGNPFHPILSIGNLVLEETTITHSGPLGLDDFPTSLKVTCKLKRARGRDANNIEQMYNNGAMRIYSGLDEHTNEIIKSSPEYKSNGNNTQLSKSDEFIEDVRKFAIDAGSKLDEKGAWERMGDWTSKQMAMLKYYYTEDKMANEYPGAEWCFGAGNKTNQSSTGKDTAAIKNKTKGTA